MGAANRSHAPGALAGLTLAAIGVVYGDIGTSPLYALKEVFAHGRVPLTAGNILGILSLVFWTLTVVVSLKYVTLILRADNNGEGGTMALMALASKVTEGRPQLRWALIMMGLMGAALFYAGRCGACRIELYGADLNRVKSAPKDDVVRCEECRRIMVRTAESGL